MQVDIALECARLQHRLSLPPLEVEDFPQVGVSTLQSTGHENPNETDILQEILSVAHVSQELINQSNFGDSSSTWGGNYANPVLPDHDFTFMVGKDNTTTQYNNSHGQVNDETNSMRYLDHKSSWTDPHARTIEIADLEDEFKTQRKVENLRWVGMSNEDVEKVLYLYTQKLIA